MSHPHPELGAPPQLAPGTLRIVPLGGLGEIGRNMTVFELDGRLLVVDCGVLFPEDHQPGVDLILPDFEHIADRLDDVEALVLTHGHEDHIGAVPYLLRLRPDIPLVGSQLTLAFVEAKLKEHQITPVTLGVKEGQRERLGAFDCEFVAVTHSIPDALAVAIRTSAGMVLHTGDFKMDQLPLDGRITDLRAFARLGEEGVDLFMADSTNAEVPGFTVHEVEIGPVLDQLFGQAEQRVIVASFASHVHRVQQVLDAAAAHERKVALVGRSMVRNMGLAAELGYLHVPEGVLVDTKELEELPPDRQVLMCTGSQGEPMAALSRMANRDHRIEVGRGDTVILASSMIPGNEAAVFRVVNGLTRLGARVVAPRAAPGGTSRATPAPASSSTATTCCALATSCRSTARCATSSPTGRSRSAAACPPRTSSSPRTAWWSTSPTAGPGSSGRCPAATSTWTAPAWAPSRRWSSRTGGSSARRASSRSSQWSTRPPARSSPGRRSMLAAWRRTTRSSSRSCRTWRARWRTPCSRAASTRNSSSRWCGASSVAGPPTGCAAGP